MGRDLPDSEELAGIRTQDRNKHYHMKLNEKKQKKQALADARLRNSCCPPQDHDKGVENKEEITVENMKDAIAGLLGAGLINKMNQKKASP